MPILSKLLKEIISFPCLQCGELPAKENGFCSPCLKRLPFVLEPHCIGCGAENDGIFDLCGKCLKEKKRPWSYAVALMRMEGDGQQLIHRMKYGNDTALARALGEMAAEKIETELWKHQIPKNRKDATPPEKTENSYKIKSLNIVDCIVPVPLHWTRRLTRGYNQTALLAQIISKKIDIPVKHLLKRTKFTPKQANLNRKKRLKNLDDAFAVKNRKFCENRKILLIDDVMTTGTTLSVASQTMLDAGAEEVNVLVLLRA